LVMGSSFKGLALSTPRSASSLGSEHPLLLGQDAGIDFAREYELAKGMAGGRSRGLSRCAGPSRLEMRSTRLSVVVSPHAALERPDQKNMQKLHRSVAVVMENPWRMRLGCCRKTQIGSKRFQRMANGSVRADQAGRGSLHLATPPNAPCQWCGLIGVLR